MKKNIKANMFIGISCPFILFGAVIALNPELNAVSIIGAVISGCLLGAVIFIALQNSMQTAGLFEEGLVKLIKEAGEEGKKHASDITGELFKLIKDVSEDEKKNSLDIADRLEAFLLEAAGMLEERLSEERTAIDNLFRPICAGIERIEENTGKITQETLTLNKNLLNVINAVNVNTEKLIEIKENTEKIKLYEVEKMKRLEDKLDAEKEAITAANNSTGRLFEQIKSCVELIAENAEKAAQASLNQNKDLAEELVSIQESSKRKLSQCLEELNANMENLFNDFYDEFRSIAKKQNNEVMEVMSQMNGGQSSIFNALEEMSHKFNAELEQIGLLRVDILDINQKDMELVERILK